MIDRTAAITAFVFAALASGTLAADKKTTKEKSATTEKCYGVALAGKNDCSSGAGSSCAFAAVLAR